MSLDESWQRLTGPGNVAWRMLDEVAPLSPHGGSEWSDKADSLSLTSSDED